MRRMNSLILQVDDTEKVFELTEGTVFAGCQLRNHEIVVWYIEPSPSADAPKHTVYLSTFAEYGSMAEDSVYIGFCGNPVFAEDETFHVEARSKTMAISVLANHSFQTSLLERFKNEIQHWFYETAHRKVNESLEKKLGIAKEDINEPESPKKRGRPPQKRMTNNE